MHYEVDKTREAQIINKNTDKSFFDSTDFFWIKKYKIKKLKRTSVTGFVRIARPIKSPAIEQLKRGLCSAAPNKKKVTRRSQMAVSLI